jgi:G:T-mismatch repair DNA endonuclease (very short patch repair protein)
LKRTNSQEKRTERYKQKYENTLKIKYGEEITNPSQLDWVQKKKEDSCSLKHESYQNYLIKQRSFMRKGYTEYVSDKERLTESRSKAKNTCLQKYGHENFGAGKIAKEKRIKTHSNTIKTWDYEERLKRTSKARESVNHRGGYSSAPEKRIRKALVELDIDFQSNSHLWNYNFDMVFGKYIIEVQGDMWHANPQKYKPTDLIMGKILAADIWAKDKRKKEKANNNGYILIEIWENEISNKTESELIEMVRFKLKENNYDFD